MIWVEIHARLVKKFGEERSIELLEPAYEMGKIITKELKKLSLLDLLRLKYGK